MPTFIKHSRYKYQYNFNFRKALVRLDIVLRKLQEGMDGSILYTKQQFLSRAIILGSQVPSMLEYDEEVCQAMNSSCVRGDDPTPKQAPS
jgi:uncharacterized protein YcsI (UPF0317 family)